MQFSDYVKTTQCQKLLNFIYEQRDKGWTLQLSFNPYITEEGLLSFPHHFDLFTRMINSYPTRKYPTRDKFFWLDDINLQFEEVLADPNGEWKWDQLSEHPNITFEQIMSHPELPWKWDYVSFNPNITLQNVLDNLDKKWKWFRISDHPNITFEQIMSHPKLPWDWGYISFNPNIILQNVLDNLGEKWNWFELSRHPNITFEQIIRHPELPWFQPAVSHNPNITFKQITDHPEFPWSWINLSCNRFERQMKLIEEQCKKEWAAAKIIKRNWVSVFWDPRHTIGRKRLERSYYNSNYSVWG